MMPGMQDLGLRWRQTRFNPLRSLTPERLASALDQKDAGWLREAALIFETIEQREPMVRSVMTKRRAAVARRDWQVVVPDPNHPNADAHKATLEYFYNNLVVTDATDLNVRAGVSGLLRQMMDAIIQKYAVHEIVWKPGAEGLTAELRRVPLYFFENRSGRLRFVGAENRTDGVSLEENGWMITCADGLGDALSICYIYKRLGLQDLLAFSEKFSVPGVLGRTSAKAGSPEGISMRDSVLAYASEWVGIVYGDDGTIKDPIQVIQTPAGSSLPQMTICEYMDRMIATLVRGGDLSTISRDNSTGSNPQADETEALLEDDCALVSETLQTQLDRLVIQMVHGDETPAAYIVVNPPSTADLTKDLAIDEGLKRLGVNQDPEDLAERYGREVAEVAEVPPVGTLQTTPTAPATPETAPTANDRLPSLAAVRSALNADLQPLGEALAGALQAGDFPAFQAALVKINQGMPALIPMTNTLSQEISMQLTGAFTGSQPVANELAANGDQPGHPFRGNQWKRWGSERVAGEIAKGQAAADRILMTHQDQIDAFEHPELGMIDFRWGTPKGGIQHVLEKHGVATVRQLPEMLIRGKVVRGTKRAYVEASDYTVLLATDYFNQPSNHWVVTGYMHHEKGAGGGGAG